MTSLDETEAQAQPLPDYSKKDLDDLLVECYKSTGLFSKTFFPETFSSPFCQLHNEILELIDSPERKIAIAAPRGLGKTTICRSLVAKSILYRDRNFVPYVSKSFSAAKLQTENLKRQIIQNRMIRKIFGSIKNKNATEYGIDESFSKDSWVAKLAEEDIGTMIFPRGSGQQIRGVLFGDKRPDLIIVDDFEDPDLICNEELRKKWKEWFFADLEKCVSRYSKDWKIVYIDTLKHEDSLLQELLDASDWCSVRLELFDDNLKSNAPLIMTDAEVQQEYKVHEEKGQLDVLYREYRNLPISTKDAVFDPKFFQKYSEPEEKLWENRNLRNVVIVDPAKTVKLHSDDSAIVCWGVDRTTHKMFLRDCVAGKMYPDELYDQMFQMVLRMNAGILGIEVTSLNEFIKQPIENEMMKRGMHPLLMWLSARAHKNDRIAQLAPFYRQGYVWHNESCCQKLESQLLSFPRSKHDDVMDASAYIIEVMDKDLLYFDPVDYDEFEQEESYKELENDDPLRFQGLI